MVPWYIRLIWRNQFKMSLWWSNGWHPSWHVGWKRWNTHVVYLTSLLWPVLPFMAEETQQLSKGEDVVCGRHTGRITSAYLLKLLFHHVEAWWEMFVQNSDCGLFEFEVYTVKKVADHLWKHFKPLITVVIFPTPSSLSSSGTWQNLGCILELDTGTDIIQIIIIKIII